jgi:hypothetical protein
MLHALRLTREFFARLEKMDEAIAAAVAAGRCQHCDGPLHRGNYQRKPRGALLAMSGESFTLRHSLCCGRRGCRKRATPPSLRFLGRRVYLEVVVIVASIVLQAVATTVQAAAATIGIPLRTLGRWSSWWREVFPKLPTWMKLRARFVPPPPDETDLPRSLVARLRGDGCRADGAGVSVNEVSLLLTARHLAPVTTTSVVEGSRFVTAGLASMTSRRECR